MKKLVKLVCSVIFPFQKQKVVLLVGTGRTGTEFIAHCFSSLYSKKIVAKHEPWPDLLDLSIKEKELSLPSNKVVSQIRFYRIKFLVKSFITKRIYLESNNNLSFLLPYLTKAFPNLRIIYIVRDLESFLISEMNKRHGQTKFLIYSEEDVRQRITPEILKGNFQENWSNFSRAKKIIWYWWACNDYVLDFLINTKTNFLIIRFEDLFSDRTISFVNLIKYIGLTPPDTQELATLMKSKKNSSKDKIFTSIETLLHEDLIYYEEKKELILQKISIIN